MTVTAKICRSVTALPETMLYLNYSYFLVKFSSTNLLAISDPKGYIQLGI